MSYLVLARKYRPRTFEQMVGQEHVVRALANALTQQRLHHAYLFTGTRGVGKTTVSRILAKSLNCTGADGSGGITAQPCGTCAACSDIDGGRFVDYVELDAASNRGVDEISQLLGQAVYKPVVGRFKVYLIDEVHMLSATAFNAMLKTLEEPPDYLKFVLATTDPQKVPVTVLSRCLQFNLRPMAPPTIGEHLAQVLREEAIEAEPGALRLLSRAAHGSMRDALSLADQAIAFGAGRLDEATVRQMLGVVDRDHAVRLIEAIAAGDGAALIAEVDGARALGLPADGVLEEIAALAQQMAVVQAVPDALDPADPQVPAVQGLAARLPSDETQLLYSLALHGRGELPLAPDEYSGLLMVLLRALAFRPGAAPTAPALRAAPPTPTPRTAAAAVSMPPRASATVVPQPPAWVDEAPPLAQDDAVAQPAAVDIPALVATPEGDRWYALVRRLVDGGAVAALVRELAMQAQCLSWDDAGGATRIRLRVERESLRSAAQQDKLSAAVADALGAPVRLEVEAGVPADSPARREAAERERRQREAEQVIHDDPLVQDMLREFKTARIVPGSVKPH